MTVSNTNTKLTYPGNGSGRNFGITFPLLSAADLRLIVTDADGTETEVVNNYTVSVHLDSVTYPTEQSGLAPLGPEKKITLLRRTPLTQEIDLQSGHALDAAELERGYDKLTLAMQEAAEEIDRAIKFPAGTAGAQTNAGAYLKTIETAVETAAAQGASAQKAASAAAASAASAASNLTLCADYCTQAETAAASAALAADNANHDKTAAANSASTAAASSAAAQTAKNSAETAAETATQKAAQLTAHNTDRTAHANILAQLAGKQPALPNGAPGQFLTKTADGVAWADAASGGGSVTVDTALSSSSENPVQNKVIKAALDEKQNALTPGANITIVNGVISAAGGGGDGTLVVDSALSDTSENPVQNKVVKAALDEKMAQYLPLAGGTVKGDLNIVSPETSKIHIASSEYTQTQGGDWYFEVPGQTFWMYTKSSHDKKIYALTARYDGAIALNTNSFLGEYKEEQRILVKKLIGSANGIAALDANTKIPEEQLPDLKRRYIPRDLGNAITSYKSSSHDNFFINGQRAGNNSVFMHVGLLHVGVNKFYRGFERGMTVTCNYDDVIPGLSQKLIDGVYAGYYTQINPSTMFENKPFIFEVVSPELLESTDVSFLRIYGHRLQDILNCSHFKIETKYGTGQNDWGVAYEYNGNGESITGQYGLFVEGVTTTGYHPVYGVRLTIYASSQTYFPLSQIELITERGHERLVDAVHALPDSGGDVYGDIVLRRGKILMLKSQNEQRTAKMFVGNDNIIYFNGSDGIWLSPSTQGPKGKPIYEQDKNLPGGVAGLNKNGYMSAWNIPVDGKTIGRTTDGYLKVISDMAASCIGHVVGEVYYSQSKDAADNPGALPLFTGETIASADTVYPDFYAWLQKHPELQCTAEEYEAALEEFGECPFYALITEDIYGPGVNIATRENAISSGEANFQSGYLAYPFDGEAAGPNGTNYWSARGQGDAGNTFVGCYLGNINLTQKVTSIKMAQGIWASSGVSSVTVQYSPDNGTTWQDLKTYDTPLQPNHGDYNVLELPDYTPAATYGLRVMAASEPENIRNWWVYELQFLTAGAKTGEEKKVRLPLLKNYVKMANAEEGIAQSGAGLPNITGSVLGSHEDFLSSTGVFKIITAQTYLGSLQKTAGTGFTYDASLASPIYGKSDTVTPAHTTLYPWVFAYSAAVPASTAQAAEFQNALSGKMDLPAGKTQADVDYVVDSYSDDEGNWYRVYKSGWVEQGGFISGGNVTIQITLLKPYSSTKYSFCAGAYANTAYAADPVVGMLGAPTETGFNLRLSIGVGGGYWKTCGKGA